MFSIKSCALGQIIKADFGLDSWCLRDFWATQAALG
jgi:hypothetical protein